MIQFDSPATFGGRLCYYYIPCGETFEISLRRIADYVEFLILSVFTVEQRSARKFNKGLAVAALQVPTEAETKAL